MKDGRYNAPSLEFQFHKGSIKTHAVALQHLVKIHFNSIKVRLRHRTDC